VIPKTGDPFYEGGVALGSTSTGTDAGGAASATRIR
jgi:hypothetical protein